MNQKFSKEERLCGKKSIDRLFTEGQSFKMFPFIVFYKESNNSLQKFPAQVLITVRKKSHKRAVVRNLLKRRTREAYRLHKTDLYNCFMEQGKKYHLALVYTGKEVEDYPKIEKRIKSIFKKFDGLNQ